MTDFNPSIKDTEEIEEPYSWDLSTEFYNYSLNYDLKNGLLLTKASFKRFPKDQDCITKIILECLENSTNVFEEKLYFNTLIIYLRYLYIEFCKNMA